MRKLLSYLLIIVLTASITFATSNIQGATRNIQDAKAALSSSPGLPKEVRDVKPIPIENYTGDYLNTTNPYSDIIAPMSASDEVDKLEGHHPLYVLIAGDEEERETWRSLPIEFYPVQSWIDWAKLQIERGDEALVANFGIDIRILGFISWESNDSLTLMYYLWYDLEQKTSTYLGKKYIGPWWTNKVDAIIGITAQNTPDDIPPIAGLTPPISYLDAGRIFILLKWQAYWMDDNLVQHEVSHLFHLDDHYESCCAMAFHKHYQTAILEDAVWVVLNHVYCSYTSYSWCNTNNCSSLLEQNQAMYQSGDLPFLAYWYCPFQDRPMTIYAWLEEASNTTWQEIKCGSSTATRR